MQKEIESLYAWNTTMSKTLRQCSSTARRWIEWQVNENKAVIAELELMK